ncbi:uncharacterized protein [Paramormyrops kingsleyae]|uniref:uncharacterized protein isoform X2 n=1 Tax=Paramormyrops kingsleyae TaxID=1676925 RepID=UPI000CD61BC9|nr:uncharacterized protein LOC111853134 isoform X2 [Paramormyrops kingsleyae]
MGTSLLRGIIFTLLLYVCKSQDIVTSRTPFSADINLPSTVITATEPKMSDESIEKPESVEHSVDDMKGERVEMEGGERDTEEAEADPREGIPAMADEVAALVEEKNGREGYNDQADDGIDQMVGAGDEEDVKNEAGGESEEEDRMGMQEGYEEDLGVEDFENYGEEVVGPDVEVEFADKEEVDLEVRDGVPVDIFTSKGSNESEIETQDLPPAPFHTYVSPRSHGSIRRKSHPESNVMGGDIAEDTNNFSEMVTPDTGLLNLEQTQTMPTLDDSLEDVASTTPSLLNEDEDLSHELLEDTTDGSALGIETWKIGTISAAIFLFLEAAVIVVYCLKYRKRTSRQTMSNLESGRTPKRESTGGHAHQKEQEMMSDTQLDSL